MGWEWGSVANWVSGIGSLAASCVALYIAERGHRIKLDGYVGKRVMIGGSWPTTNILAISVTNMGSRTAKISNVSMKCGRKRNRRLAIIGVGVPDENHPWIITDKLPKSLEDGDSANWHIYLGDDDDWIVSLVRDGFIKSWLDIETLFFVIHTSQGAEKIIRPELNVRTQLHDLIRKQPTSTSK